MGSRWEIRSKRTALRVMVCLAWLTLTCVALADESGLRWQAPASCPSQSAVHATILENLGGRTSLPPELRAVGRLKRTGQKKYRLNLSVHMAGTHSGRVIEGNDCASLTRAAAWLIALAVDPTLSARAEAPEEQWAGASASAASEPSSEASTRNENAATPASPATPDATPAGQPATGPAPQPPAARVSATKLPDTRRAVEASTQKTTRSHSSTRPPDEFRLGAFGGAFSANLPGAQGSLGFRAGLGWGRFVLESRYAYMFARSREIAPDTRVEFGSQQLGLAGCGQWGKTWRFGPCVTLTGTRTEGAATGITSPQNNTRFWAASGLSGYLNAQLVGPLEASLEVGAELALSPRPRFSIEGVGEVGHASFLSGYARFGFGVRIR